MENREDHLLSCKYISCLLINESDVDKKNLYLYDYIYTMKNIKNKDKKYEALKLLIESLLPSKHRDIFINTNP